MSETMEGHHAHHSSGKGNDFSLYVLPLSILLAAVIIGWSMMSAATALGNGLDGLTIGGGPGPAVPNLPTPDNGDLAPSGPTQTMAELVKNGAGSAGSESAPVVIVEYSDFQCPYCRAWFKQSKAHLFEKYVDTGKVQFVYKDFPLNFHAMAAPSANAARCAGDQGKYWEYHDALYAEQDKLNAQGGTTQYTLDDLKAWGKNLGLNEAQFNACVDDNKYASEIAANMAEGQSAGVTGTPSFVIGKRGESGVLGGTPGTPIRPFVSEAGDTIGYLVIGAQPYSSFETALTELLG